MLSVSFELLKMWIKGQVLWIVLIPRCKSVEMLPYGSTTSVSHSVSGWSAGRHHVSLSASAVHISCSDNIDVLIPEIQMSQNSWSPKSFHEMEIFDILHVCLAAFNGNAFKMDLRGLLHLSQHKKMQQEYF